MNGKTFIIGLIALIGFTLCYQQIFGNKLVAEPTSFQASVLSADNKDAIETSASSETLAADIVWMSWQEAVEANKKAPKKMIIDVYTDWCGWCKRMDATTFKDPKVTSYIAENFYAVKFDAEQKEDIVYDGNTFSFQRQGNRGVHTLAASLLDNRLSYPSVVYLNANMERIMISPGYKDADSMIKELKYANGEGEKP